MLRTARAAKIQIHAGTRRPREGSGVPRPSAAGLTRQPGWSGGAVRCRRGQWRRCSPVEETRAIMPPRLRGRSAAAYPGIARYARGEAATRPAGVGAPPTPAVESRRTRRGRPDGGRVGRARAWRHESERCGIGRGDRGAAAHPRSGLMHVVGLVTHSGAAQDVRRITSLARTIDVHERVNVTARILAGLAAMPGVRVLYLSEPTRVVERALATLAALPEAVTVAAEPVAGAGVQGAAVTRAAAAALADAGAACVVTLGGDGTNREVAAGWPGAVMVPAPRGHQQRVRDQGRSHRRGHGGRALRARPGDLRPGAAAGAAMADRRRRPPGRDRPRRRRPGQRRVDRRARRLGRGAAEGGRRGRSRSHGAGTGRRRRPRGPGRRRRPGRPPALRPPRAAAARPARARAADPTCG